MLLKTTSPQSGEKFDIRKYCIIIISLTLVSIQIQAQPGWTPKAPMPTPRGGSCACVVDNKIYVIGGYNNIINLDVNEVYDPSTDTWQTKSPLPQPRGWPSCSVVNDIIYVIGGGYPTATKTVYAFDPDSNKWTQKADMLSVRRAAQAFEINGIIYLIGGHHGDGLPASDCEAYNPVTNTWTPIASMPTGQGRSLGAAVYNGSIYTFGGSDNSSWTPHSLTYSYNPQLNWIQKQNMPTARFGHQAFTIGNEIYVLGGDNDGSGPALNKLEVYYPDSNKWESRADMPFNSVFFAGASLNGKIYVMGGSSDWVTSLSKTWEYTPPVIPVELTSFTAAAKGKEVTLSWSTATELNNLGFEIQRSTKGKDFFTVGFVNGHGTITEPQNYSYADRNLNNGKYYYRLKQVDYDGRYEYSDVVEVDYRVFNSYLLEQNYPNPFNPTTTIGFGLQSKSDIKIAILNAIGEELAVVLNEEKESGFYQVEFNAANLPSGVYFCQLKAGEYVNTKKMILLK
jgi:N-acetylneuraminic acid mutarotase